MTDDYDPSDRDAGDAGDADDVGDSGDGDDLPAFPADDVDVPDVPPSRDPADPSGGGFGDPDAIDDLPTVSCSRCDREWDLAYELDELSAGNRALEQFAMDHERHTGHYPDGLTPWTVDCRQCPAADRFLAERPARRFALTHARHTRHEVDLGKPDADVSETVTGPAASDGPTDGSAEDPTGGPPDIADD